MRKKSTTTIAAACTVLATLFSLLVLANTVINAEAQTTQTWYLDDATFSDAATAVGSFQYNPALREITSTHITLKEKDSPFLRTFTNVALGGDQGFIAADRNGGGDLEGATIVTFVLNESLNQSSSTIIQLSGDRKECENTDCTEFSLFPLVWGADAVYGPPPPTFTTPSAINVNENWDGLTQLTADGMGFTDHGLVFELAGGDDEDRFRIRGQKLLMDPPNYEQPQDANRDNAYKVRVQVTDITGRSAEQTITISVANLPETTWHLFGVKFSSGATAKGSFTLDPNGYPTIAPGGITVAHNGETTVFTSIYATTINGRSSFNLEAEAPQGTISVPNFYLTPSHDLDGRRSAEIRSGSLVTCVTNQCTTTDVLRAGSLATMGGAGSFVLHGQPTWNTQPDAHSFAVNDNEDGALVAVKTDGRLYVRRFDIVNQFFRWEKQGASGWATADIAIDENGQMELIAVKTDGRLFTRTATPGRAFGPWTQHGAATWDPDAKPTISTNGTTVTFAAVKADGRLYTRERSGDTTWSNFKKHGATGWAHVDLSIAKDGDVWFIATKTDGRLYLRNKTGASWSSFTEQGTATWSSTVPPSIAARSAGVVYAATKANGALFTRQQTDGAWENFVQHGRGNWAAGVVDMNEQGAIALAAVKNTGAMYTRISLGNWHTWTKHGQDTWSTSSSPSVTIAYETQTHVAAVKDNGYLYTRPFG